LRFVWAVVAFVLAAILIGAGIAQRTVFLGPKTEEATVSVEQDLPYLLVDGAVLTHHTGAQTLTVPSNDAVFAAYGRTDDVRAWLSDVEYNHVVVGGDDEIETVLVEPEAVDPESADDAADPAADAATDDAATDDAATDEAAGRNPAGSDLWLEETTQDRGLVMTLNLPEDMSVLIATDGTEAAPGTLELSWPISNSTPWAGPLIVLGSILMAFGVFLYILAIRHVRRSRGPRRKGPPPLPETQPLDTLSEAPERGVITSRTAQRSVLARRAVAIVPAVAVSALLFAGCSAEAWPQLGPSASPSPTPSVLDAENAQAPAVTDRQAERILARIAQTAAAADAAADPELAATRLGGAVLDERKANYTIRGKFPEIAALDPIPSGRATVLLPQAYDGWPRTVLMVIDEAGAAAEDGESAPQPDATEEGEAETTEPTAPESPTILLMSQEDPWSDYTLTYLAHFAASTTLPDVAGATIGASQVTPDSTFLVIAPDQLATAYADVINKGEESEFASLFSPDGDQFRAKLAEKRTQQLDAFNQTGAQTGTLSFSSAAGAYPAFAFATLESGAIVAVSLTETETVKSTNPDAVIKLDGNRAAQALSGMTSSAKGFETTHSDQLFFYVPNRAAGGQIELLGYSSQILSAGEIQ